MVWKVKRRLTFQSSCIYRLRCFTLDSCLDVYLCILFDIRGSIKLTYCWNESWWLLTAGIDNCLKPMTLRHRHGWPTASFQLRCGSGLWVEAAEKTNSPWPELQLLGLCSRHRLHSLCATHWRVRGFYPQHTSLWVPLFSSPVGLSWAPGISSGRAFILLAQTVGSVAQQQRVSSVLPWVPCRTVDVCHDSLSAEILVPKL